MHRFLYICLSFAAVAALLSASQQQTSSDPAKKTKLLGSSPEPIMPTPLVAPLFVEDNSTESVITMASHSSSSLDVDVTLFALSGDELAKKTITIAAHSEQTVNVADLLANAPTVSASTYGSVLLRPHRPAALAAQLSIVSRIGSPQDIEEEFAMPMNPKPASYRAVTSGLSAAPVLAIRSMSTAQQTVSISCLIEAGGVRSSSMPIAPNQTLLIQVCHERGPKLMANLEETVYTGGDPKQGFAISVSSSVPSTELAVFGFGAHRKETDHSFSSIPFWDVNMSMSSTAIYPAVPPAQSETFGTQSFQLRASAANFSNVPRKATILLTAGSGANSTQQSIATLILAPNTVSAVDLPEIGAEPVPSHSLIIQAEGQPGDILTDVQAISTSRGARLSVTLPGKDKGQMENSGEHPWVVSDSVSSTVLLFNPDPELKNGAIQLTVYVGQTVWIKKLSLAPLATMAISLNEIIQKQQPDDQGKMLPPSSSHGLVTWSSLSKPRVFGKLVQLDGATGTERTYACNYTLAICGASLPDLVITFGRDTGWEPYPIEACDTQGDCNCIDSCINDGSSIESDCLWSNWNGSIIGINDPSSCLPDVRGNGVGTTTASVNVVDVNGCFPNDPPQGQASVTPAIQWNGNDITDSLQNAVVGQQIVLMGNPGGGTWSFNTPVVSTFQVASDGSSGASIPVNASGNPVTLYWVSGGYNPVTYTLSGQPGYTNFNVSAPSYNGITVVPQAPTITPDSSGAPWLRLGYFPSQPPGISFSASIDSPSGYFGLASWVQIINATTIEAENPGGGYTVCSAPPGLDNHYPYSYALQTDDSPGLALQGQTFPSIEDTQSFSMYLMWDPSLSNSIPVPVAVVEWGWDGIASLNGSSYSASGSVANYTVSSTTTYPAWTTKITNGVVGNCGYVDGRKYESLSGRFEIRSDKLESPTAPLKRIIEPAPAPAKRKGGGK